MQYEGLFDGQPLFSLWPFSGHLGTSHTSKSLHYSATERSEHNKWKPAGGKDVGFEILAFYLARQLQSRANGCPAKKLCRKGWRLS